MGCWISFKISIWLTGENIAFWPVKNLHADQLDVIPGGTSSQKVQGCSCQIFEHDPKKWKAKKFVPKIWVLVPKVFLLVNQLTSMFAIGNFENIISSTY